MNIKQKERRQERERLKDIFIDKLILDKFYIEELIGSGSYCYVFKASNTVQTVENQFKLQSISSQNSKNTNKTVPNQQKSRQNSKDSIKTVFSQNSNKQKTTLKKIYAVKIEEKNQSVTRRLTLLREAKILKKMNNTRGFPILYHFQSQDDYSYMVTQLLGQSLKQLLQQYNRTFSITSVMLTACQSLNRLRDLHNKGYVHRDLNLGNLLIGNSEKTKEQIYLIDFGLSNSYKQKDGSHIPFRRGCGWVGTPTFMSINTHEGIEYSRRDDLISLFYILLYLAKGSLPWQRLCQVEDEEYKSELIAEKKRSINYYSYCQDMPFIFVKYYEYVSELNFYEYPNYDYLIGLFQDELIQRQNKAKQKICFDWSNPEQTKIYQVKKQNPEYSQSSRKIYICNQNSGQLSNSYRTSSQNSKYIQKSQQSQQKQQSLFGQKHKQLNQNENEVQQKQQLPLQNDIKQNSTINNPKISQFSNKQNLCSSKQISHHNNNIRKKLELSDSISKLEKRHSKSGEFIRSFSSNDLDYFINDIHEKKNQKSSNQALQLNQINILSPEIQQKQNEQKGNLMSEKPKKGILKQSTMGTIKQSKKSNDNNKKRQSRSPIFKLSEEEEKKTQYKMEKIDKIQEQLIKQQQQDLNSQDLSKKMKYKMQKTKESLIFSRCSNISRGYDHILQQEQIDAQTEFSRYIFSDKYLNSRQDPNFCDNLFSEKNSNEVSLEIRKDSVQFKTLSDLGESSDGTKNQDINNSFQQNKITNNINQNCFKNSNKQKIQQGLNMKQSNNISQQNSNQLSIQRLNLKKKSISESDKQYIAFLQEKEKFYSKIQEKKNNFKQDNNQQQSRSTILSTEDSIAQRNSEQKKANLQIQQQQNIQNNDIVHMQHIAKVKIFDFNLQKVNRFVSDE